MIVVAYFYGKPIENEWNEMKSIIGYAFGRTC